MFLINHTAGSSFELLAFFLQLRNVAIMYTNSWTTLLQSYKSGNFKEYLLRIFN